MDENEEEGIEILCPVCRQPMNATEDVSECVNPMCNVYELDTETWYTITRHIETMQMRIDELEAEQAKIEAAKTNTGIFRLFMLRFWGQDVIEKFCLDMLGPNWMQLKTDSEALASWILAYFGETTKRDKWLTGIIEMAVRLAPQPVADAPGTIIGGSGVWRGGLFVPHETPDKVTLDIIAAMQRGSSDVPCVTPRTEIHSTPQQVERIINALRAPSVEGAVVDGAYIETPLSPENMGTQIFEALADDKQNLHFKPKP